MPQSRLINTERDLIPLSPLSQPRVLAGGVGHPLPTQKGEVAWSPHPWDSGAQTSTLGIIFVISLETHEKKQEE